MAEKPVTAPFYPNSDPPIYRGQCTQCDEPLADIVSATALTP
jgi:hypothetical protein